MAEYSNLLRGGGVSTSRRRTSSGGGGSKIVIFIVLCLLVLSGFWLYGKFFSKANNDSVTTENSAEVQSSTSDDIIKKLPKIEKDINKDLPTTKQLITSSVSPQKMKSLKMDYKAAELALGEDELVAAIDHAKKIINSDLSEDDELWKKSAQILGDANIKIFMSDIPTKKKQLYTIQDGDSLIRIANKFKTTVESVQKSNGLNPASPIIFPGKTLYIYTGAWSIKVSKSKFKLYLYDGDDLFKIYSVGIGKQGRTPSGSFVIYTKQKEPIWYNDGKAIAYGSKENVLGTRWMSLKPIGDTNSHLRGYGIHGTWQPETIGTKSSNGCIRMKNNEVDELYSIIPYKTSVIIED